MNNKTACLFVLVALLFSACQNKPSTGEAQQETGKSRFVLPEIVTINVEGNFTAQIIPHNYFFYEPEGIIVWECETDSSGYYLMVDQGKISNTFQVFDRKTLEYIGGFGGEITRNTDGVAITQKTFGSFKHGAFYPVHNDGSLTAISWEDIAKTLNLRYDCN